MEQLSLVCNQCGLRPVIPWKGIGRRPVRCEKCSTAKSNAKATRRLVKDPVEDKRAAARKAVAWAKETGRLIVGPCAVCRSTVNVQGHHHDYDQQLNVTWLCQTHHWAIDVLMEIKTKVSAKKLAEIQAWCPPQWDSRVLAMTP